MAPLPLLALVLTLALALTLVPALALTGCGDDPPAAAAPLCTHTSIEETCIGVTLAEICAETFCTAGATCSQTYYVDAGGGDGDGSSGSPFASLAAAAAKATSGACIAVAAGSYKAAELAGGVSLLGRGVSAVTITGGAGDRAALVLGAGQGGIVRGVTLAGAVRGIFGSGAQGLKLTQLKVSAVKDVGIDLRKSTGLTLDGVTVEQTSKGTKGGGIGLLLAGGSTAVIKALVSADNAGIGIQVSESSIRSSGTTVENNGSYGIAIDCSVDAGCKGALASEIAYVQSSGNKGVGLWFRGGKVLVKDSVISHTRTASYLGRGIEASGAALVDLRDNKVHNNVNEGIVLDSSSGAVSGNTVEDNDSRGIWVQNLASSQGKLELKNNQVKGNKMVGIGALACVGLTISGGLVSKTREGFILSGPIPPVVADGVQLLKASDAVVDGVHLEGNSRAGLLLDGSKGTIKNNTISGSKTALVTQRYSPTEVSVSNNTSASGAAVKGTVPATALVIDESPLALISINPLPLP